MPRATRLQADLSSLNASQFSPVKDYERNLILPSPLQLGEGTALIVDETRMAEGTLSPQGVQSVRALSEVVQRQTLPARFAYCEVAVRGGTGGETRRVSWELCGRVAWGLWRIRS